ncbi:MAG: hypothetical protein KF705_11620 [Phycisphaeraceae bacterium]|nr:hypothetical protein [Phycisphaeraceae bacterium]
MARRRMLKARFYGLVGAGAFAIGAGALITFLIVSANEAPQLAEDSETPAPPDIREALPQNASIGAMAGKDLRVQMMDKADPTRQSGELRAAVVDPMQLPGHYAVDKPQIWMFLKNGKTLFVRADSGQLVMPSRRQEPESGVLRGSVEIRIYDTIGVGDETELGAPSIVARMPVLTFDTTVPELESPQPFTVQGRGILFEGQTLRVLASQTRERLELVEVLRGGRLVYTPSEAGKGRSSAAPAMLHPTRQTFGRESMRATNASYQPRAQAPQTPQSAAPGDANIVHYMTTFADDVVVTQTTRILTGDRLDVWSRIIDGRLPDGAIGGSSPRTPERSEAPPSESPITPAVTTRNTRAATNNPPSQSASPPSQRVTAQSDETDGSVELTWKGVMVARPLAYEPVELELDDVWLRVTADRTGLVKMDDTASGAEGRCTLLEYAATRQEIAIARSGAEGATLSLPGKGRITATRIEQNLATGIGYVPGAGLMESLDVADARDPQRPMARWSRSAVFAFETLDGRMSDRPERVMLEGNSLASASGSSISGETIEAWFSPTSAAQSSPSLSRVRSQGGVLARDAAGNSIQSELLDVQFVSQDAGANPEPSVATAIGSVRVASSQGDIVTAGFVEADLARDPTGNLTAHTARAEEWVEVTTSDGKQAVASMLFALVPEQLIDLSGPGSSVSQSTPHARTTAKGELIRLDGLSNAITITGPGSFAHESSRTSEETPGRSIKAAWTESMMFDDARGELRARGDVRAESNVSILERQTIEADSVDVNLEPAGTFERRLRDARRDGLPTPEREIVFAQSTSDPETGTDSMVQAVYYAIDNDAPEGRRIERLFQAQGAVITSDQSTGTLEIPGPGRFVVADLRDKPTGADRSPGMASQASSRGRTLFRWDGAMRFERATGIVRLNDNASMVQRRLQDDGVVNVNASMLEARVQERSAAAPSQPAFDLTGVTATGNVVVIERVGSPLTLKREIVADRLDYDTVRGVAEATATTDSGVTLFEIERGTPIRARSIFWDLVQDRIDVRGLSPVTSPR